MTHEEAVRDLRSRGETTAADALDAYTSRDNDKKGWDGWLRQQFPNLADSVVGVTK